MSPSAPKGPAGAAAHRSRSTSKPNATNSGLRPPRKKRRSERNQGSLYKRASDGLWIVAMPGGIDASGRRKRRTRAFQTKALAETFHKQERAKVLSGRRPAHSPTMLLKDYLDGWLADNQPSLPNGTYHAREVNVRRFIKPYLGHVTLNRLDHRLIDYWLNNTLPTKEPRLALRTRAHAKAVLHKALTDAVKTGVIAEHPMRLGIKVAGSSASANETKPMQAAEATAFVRAVSMLLPPEWRAVMLLPAVLALRAGEVLGLREQDYTPARGPNGQALLRLRKQLQRRRSEADSGEAPNGSSTQLLIDLKTRGSVRELVIPAFVADAIEERLRVNRAQRSTFGTWNPARLLFCQQGGDLYVYEDFWRDFRRICVAAGLTYSTRLDPSGYNPHDLRATAITVAAEQGTDLSTLMNMAGHSSPVMTLRYLKSLMTMKAKLAGQLQAHYAPVHSAANSSRRSGVPSKTARTTKQVKKGSGRGSKRRTP